MRRARCGVLDDEKNNRDLPVSLLTKALDIDAVGEAWCRPTYSFAPAATGSILSGHRRPSISRRLAASLQPAGMKQQSLGHRPNRGIALGWLPKYPHRPIGARLVASLPQHRSIPHQCGPHISPPCGAPDGA